MRNQKNNQEKGQAIFFIALAFLGLLGFVSLSIDGGRIFLDRREAQNAADTAVFAAAFAIIESKNEDTVGKARAAQNGFDNLGSATVGNTVTVNYPPASGSYSGDSEYVQVVITIVSETAFMHMFTSEIATSTVDAVARVELIPSSVKGMAIVTLGNCLTDGATLQVNGGGTDGQITVTGAGVFINSPETSGSPCAISGSSSSQSQGISVPCISSVGDFDYSSASGITIDCSPMTTGHNGGKLVTDPYADSYEDPQCLGLGTKTADGSGTYDHILTPGHFAAGNITTGDVFLEPGIYCIWGDLGISGTRSIVGDGVVLFFVTGKLRVTGQGGYSITAPKNSNCLTSASGDTYSSCTYKGFAIYMADGNCNSVDVAGNGGTAVVGMIYAPCSQVNAKGGGSTADQTEIMGQIIAKKVVNGGNGSLILSFDGNVVPDPPPEIELVD